MVATSSRTPRARYDERGNLSVDFPASVQRAPLFPVARRTIAGLAPGALHDWEPGGHDCAWIDWRVARQVERHLRTLWPDLRVAAVANPRYALAEPQPEALAFFDPDRSLRIYMPLDGGFCHTLERCIPAYGRAAIDGLPCLPSAYRIDAEYALIVLNSLAANWPTVLVTPEVGPER